MYQLKQVVVERRESSDTGREPNNGYYDKLGYTELVCVESSLMLSIAFIVTMWHVASWYMYTYIAHVY